MRAETRNQRQTVLSKFNANRIRNKEIERMKTKGKRKTFSVFLERAPNQITKTKLKSKSVSNKSVTLYWDLSGVFVNQTSPIVFFSLGPCRGV